MCRAFVLLVLIAACSSGGSTPAPPAPDPDPNPVPAPFGLGDTRASFGGGTFPLDPQTNPDPVTLTRAFPSVSMDYNVFLTAAPDGTDRIFVLDKAGVIWVIPNDDAATTRKTFLDLTSKVSDGGERGLLGLAFDPDYATNGTFYVHYSTGTKGRISRFQVSGDPDQADASSESVVLEVPDSDSNHNGGMLAFGPDGKLYASVGDDYTKANAQDRTTLLGKVLRIDPKGGTPYAIPSDNPFVGVGGGVRAEIWAYGFRNPWRFSFDRSNGDLWLGDVGDLSHEEIDLVTKGGNYGWAVYEANEQRETPPTPTPTYIFPVLEKPHSCIIGGYVYRGSKVTSLSGAYIYGDYNSGEVRALRYNGTTVTSDTKIGQGNHITSLGEDRDGEIYVVEPDRIWRVTGGGTGGPPVPAKLSQTGLFQSVLDLTPVAGLIEYGVNAPLWSDGAVKRRWLGLPGSTHITFDATGNWQFPVGTVLVKHFELPVSATERTRLETRVLIRQNNGWAGYLYRWNLLGTDADLIDDAETQAYTVEDASAPGGTREQVWTFPSRAQCMLCHTSGAGFVLGPRTRQINRTFDYGSVTDNQLRAWNHIGLFDTDIGEASDYEAMPDPRDTAAPLTARARAYLDANCAQCHRPGNGNPVDIDLRYGTPLESTNLVDVVPAEGDLGLTDARRIRPGSKESSVLWERMRRLDATRMPPLGSALVDAEAVALLGEWIDGGP
jgi:uncharacterized repeat protein (TIGR03806 family)